MNAAAPLIARDLGRDRNAIAEQVQRTVRQAFLPQRSAWRCRRGCVLWWAAPILRLARPKSRILSESRLASYVRALMWSMLPFMLLFGAARFRECYFERPVATLLISVSGGRCSMHSATGA